MRFATRAPHPRGKTEPRAQNTVQSHCSHFSALRAPDKKPPTLRPNQHIAPCPSPPLPTHPRTCPHRHAPTIPPPTPGSPIPPRHHLTRNPPLHPAALHPPPQPPNLQQRAPRRCRNVSAPCLPQTPTANTPSSQTSPPLTYLLDPTVSSPPAPPPPAAATTSSTARTAPAPTW